MGIAKGTKLVDSPKDRMLKFRYDEELGKKLDFLCKETSRTKSQVIRDGIEQQFAEAKK